MADGQNPFMGMLNPNMRQTSLWDLRMMSAANRSETPFERGARGMYRRQGVAGDPMLSGLAGLANEPDYSRFTFDPTAHAAASQALSRYGLAPLEASQVKQNQVLPNTGFFGDHPRLSAALEGGLFGALASHGGETPGESIQGALEGLVGGRRIQQGMYRQQFARPFEAAGMMEQLQDVQQKRDLQDADIQHLRALNEHLIRGDDEKAQRLTETNRHQEAMEALGFQRTEATAPRNLGGGLYGYYDPSKAGTGQSPWVIQENPEFKAGRGAAAKAGYLKGIVPDPTGKTAGQYTEIAPGQPIPKGFQSIQSTPEERNTKAAAGRKDAFIKANLAASKIFGLGYKGDMTDGKAKTKFLGDLYDQTHAGENMPEAGGSPGFKQNPDGSYTEQ